MTLPLTATGTAGHLFGEEVETELGVWGGVSAHVVFHCQLQLWSVVARLLQLRVKQSGIHSTSSPPLSSLPSTAPLPISS